VSFPFKVCFALAVVVAVVLLALSACDDMERRPPTTKPANEATPARVENAEALLSAVREVEREGLVPGVYARLNDVSAVHCDADLPEPPPLKPATIETARQIVAGAEGWLIASQQPCGLFAYEYDPLRDRIVPGNNAVRQLLASVTLADLAARRPDLTSAHRRNLDYMFMHWYRERDGVGYIHYADHAELGSLAMAVRMFAVSPLLKERRAEADALAKGIVACLKDDGSFRPLYFEGYGWRISDRRALQFFSGEAIVALVDYHLRTGDPRWLAAARRAQEHYLQEYVAEIEQNYYPAYVPWHTQSLNKLYQATGDQRYPKAVFVMNDRLLELLDTTDCVGRFYRPDSPFYGGPHSSGDAVFIESLTYALEIAALTGETARARAYGAALDLAVAHFATLQYSLEEALDFPRPWLAVGGVRSSDTRPEIRIDNTSHCIDALGKLVRIAKNPRH